LGDSTLSDYVLLDRQTRWCCSPCQRNGVLGKLIFSGCEAVMIKYSPRKTELCGSDPYLGLAIRMAIVFLWPLKLKSVA
ncbi:hypothetical protein M8C21_005266, partial [Ambrosia artemisiifolia]